ncbi:hypothetical protein JXO52_00180 [bacterium]|nr:hypothetical protein [bacterium]
MKNIIIVSFVLLCAAPEARPAVQHGVFADSLGQDRLWRISARLPEELLEPFSGIFPYRTDLPGYWSLFSGNGLTPANSVVLFDGMQLTDPWTGENDLNLVPAAALAGIGWHRNSIYGISAPGGVLTCTSLPPHEEKPRTRIFYRSGAGKFNELDVSYDQRITSNLTMAAGVQLQNNTVSDSLSYLKKQAVRASIFYRPSKRVAISYRILQNRTKINLPFTLALPGDSTRLHQPRRQRIRYDHALSTRIVSPAADVDITLHHAADEFSFYERAGGRRRIIPVYRTRITLNQQFRGALAAFSLSEELSRSAAAPLTGPRAASSHHRFSLLLQPQPGERFSGNADATIQLSGDGRPYVTGSGTLYMRLSGTFGLGLYVGSLVREPTLGERFGFPVSFLPSDTAGAPGILTAFAANESLSPERSVALRIPLVFSTGGFALTMQPGITGISNRITASAYRDTLQRYTNTGSDAFLSLTADLHLALFPGLELVSSFTAHDQDTPCQAAPPFSGRTALSWRRDYFSGDLKLRTTVALRYRSSWTPCSPLFMEQAQQAPVPSGTTLDAVIDAVVIENARVSVALDNILNSTQELFVQAPLRGRSLRMSLCWTFLD